ncbi:MAG: PfaD family polyunsaturated fatty acid/polyketide biosynthesis protein [Myxococcota bacterium]|nr:PfaD family polyunsaturated fatty acid/polyketide biosynthesis protein [Myxococcota bacterium]
MPLDVLERFGAATSRVFVGESQQERSGAGGALEASVERLGLGMLGGVFHAHADLHRLELEDPDVRIDAVRADEVIEVQVQWESGTAFTERLPIAPVAGLLPHDGAFLVPQADSRHPDLRAALRSGAGFWLCESGDGLRAFGAGRVSSAEGALPVLGRLPERGQLGSAAFCAHMGIRHAYLGGAMAGGIASAAMVIALGRAGLMGFFGAGGLGLDATEQALAEIRDALTDGQAYGANLLHNPQEPAVEMATVELYARYGVRTISASAFMGLTPALLRHRYTGIALVDGKPVCPNRVIAKISRPEVAKHFLSPPPEAALQELVDAGHLSAEQAEWALQLPVADAITCEADSGGHTDRRPLPVLVPIILQQRAQIAAEQGYAERGIHIFVGAAGGLGSPESIVGALAMGAEYVLTGSVNQATPEAGTSDIAKEMLLEAGMADCAEGPAPDMFELGAHVQVLSRGTMYARRGKRLYDLYKQYSSWEEIPAADQKKVEKQILGAPFAERWESTAAYWQGRDPAQVTRAQENGRHKMALVFRWYLGMASRWARLGDTSRKRDFQIWCGPSMGAFNAWVQDTPLQPLAARKVADVADALIQGSLQLQGAQALAAQGVAVPAALWDTRPL